MTNTVKNNSIIKKYNKMRKLIPLILILLFVCSEFTLAGERFGQRLRLSDKTNSKVKPYFKDIEEMRAKKNKIFNLDLDIHLGADFSNTKVDVNQTADTSYNAQVNALQNSKAKVGPSISAILNFDFLGFGFTTGATYSSKGFKTESNGTETSQNRNYFNIPLLFNFSIDIGKVMIDGNVGPYFGLLISQDESDVLSKVKNFDLGITGNLEGAYMFKKYLGALLGFKYDYGGLNNLGQNFKINSIRTNTYYIYTGVKFVI